MESMVNRRLADSNDILDGVFGNSRSCWATTTQIDRPQPRYTIPVLIGQLSNTAQ